jgi:hypothetical protein
MAIAQHYGTTVVCFSQPFTIFGHSFPGITNPVYQASAQQTNGQYLQDNGKNTYLSVHVSGNHVTITPIS